MSPTQEASERQRKAAYKAWETIRRKAAEKVKVNGGGSEIAEVAKAKEIVSEIRKTVVAKKATISKERAYPENWKQIRDEIRERAHNAHGHEQCECRGECLKHHGRCEEINHTWPQHRRRKGKVKIRFTIAHLCHTPKCEEKSHLRAMCEPCHLIYDLRCRQQFLRGDQAVEWAMRQGQKSLRT